MYTYMAQQVGTDSYDKEDTWTLNLENMSPWALISTYEDDVIIA